MGLVAPALDWRFACPDWEQRLREGRSIMPDLPLDLSEAGRAIAIFNKLRLPDVPGQPLLADAAGEWQREIVRAIFGSLDADTNLRMVREVFGLVPKKNAKTTGGAAIMVTALLMNERPRAEFVLVGPTQEVADTAFQQAAGMIEADPFLRTRYHIAEHRKTITDRLNKAFLKIKTFDMKVATGSKPAGVLLDELHLMSSMADASRVIGQLRGGMIANPEAFLIIITTQSDKPPAGAFKAELDYARGVRDGRIVENVSMLPMLYEFSERMQIDPAKPWREPVNWHMVLPNAGRSITVDRLVSEYQTAVEKGEEEERRWASQHLNVEIGLALHTDRWIGADHWLAQADTSITIDALLERCEVIVGGADGGGLDDLFGLALIGRCRETKQWLGWNRAWAQPAVWDRRKEIVGTLDDFVKDGDLVKCQLPTQDLEEIGAILSRINKSGLLPKENAIGLDPHGITALVEELIAQGLKMEQLQAVPQGFRLSGPVWGLERKLQDGTFVHAGQRLMNWCVGNAKTEQRGNAVLITKQAAGKAKIDPLIATFNAVALMSRNPASNPPSVYTRRGIRRV